MLKPRILRYSQLNLQMRENSGTSSKATWGPGRGGLYGTRQEAQCTLLCQADMG